MTRTVAAAAAVTTTTAAATTTPTATETTTTKTTTTTTSTTKTTAAATTEFFARPRRVGASADNPTTTTPTAPEQFAASADAAWAFLGKKDSVFRALLIFLSSGGLFFSAQCFEKTLWAFKEHSGVTQDTFRDIARHQGEAALAPAEGEMSVLTRS